jgi:hypothetical protein
MTLLRLTEDPRVFGFPAQAGVPLAQVIQFVFELQYVEHRGSLSVLGWIEWWTEEWWTEEWWMCRRGASQRERAGGEPSIEVATVRR